MLKFKDLVEGLVRGQDLIEQERRKRDEKRQKEASNGNGRRTT